MHTPPAARTFVPVLIGLLLAAAGHAAPLPIGPDDQAVVGHWRFDGDPTDGFKDLTGSGRDAALHPGLTDVQRRPAPGAIIDDYPHVLRFGEGAIVIPTLRDAMGDGPFTVEMIARLDRDGYIIRTDNSHDLALTYLFRDAGWLQLRYHNVVDDQASPRHIIDRRGIAEPFGLISPDRFHHIALTYDGQRMLRFYLDGMELATFEREGDGVLPFPRGNLIVGWQNKFNGTAFREIAALRISNVARTFSPRPRPTMPTLSDAVAQHAVKIDLTAADSPTAENHLRDDGSATYTAARGFGRTAPPSGTFDTWFIGAWMQYKPEDIIKHGSRYAPLWELRDGHDVPSGSTYRIDLPAGRWDVTAVVGHPWDQRRVDSVTANGVTLGSDIHTKGMYWRIYPVDRGARGIVDVGDDGLQITFKGSEPVGLYAVEAYPYAPDPVPGLSERAAALGVPQSPTDAQIDEAEDICRALEAILHRDPDNRAAATLHRQVDLLREILTGVSKGITHRVNIGPAFRMPVEAAGLALRLQPDEPTFAQARFLGGTVLYWIMMEGGMKPDELFPHPNTYLEAAHQAHPAARLPRIYLGEKLPIAKTIDVPQGAPRWAELYHRAITRITDVHLWWVNEKQDENGLLGGGFGDDVEATRSWPVSVIAADLEPVREGWRKLADYGWRKNPHVYQTRINDIEHGSEDFADSHMFPVFFEYGGPRFDEMMKRTSEVWPTFRDVWTRIDDQGFRVFKSSTVSLTETHPEPAGDSAYGTRCISAGMFRVFFTNDPEEKRLLLEYADNWAEAILAERSGKPAGICPVWINPDRTFGLKKGQWWTGMIGIHYPIPTYNVYDLLLGAYDLSGDEKYLEPIHAGAALMRDNPKPDGDLRELPKGSLLWSLYAPYIYDRYTGGNFIAHAAATARTFTGDTRNDDVLLEHGPAWIQSRILLDRGEDDALQPIDDELTAALANLDYNIEMVTTEVRRTDRIYLDGISATLGMATSGSNGGGNAAAYWPNFSVTWKNTGPDVAIFVTRTDPDHVTVKLYNTDPQPRDVTAHLWRMTPGSYTATLTGAEPQTFNYAQRGDSVTVTLPAQREVVLDIQNHDAP